MSQLTSTLPPSLSPFPSPAAAPVEAPASAHLRSASLSLSLPLSCFRLWLASPLLSLILSASLSLSLPLSCLYSSSGSPLLSLLSAAPPPSPSPSPFPSPVVASVETPASNHLRSATLSLFLPLSYLCSGSGSPPLSLLSSAPPISCSPFPSPTSTLAPARLPLPSLRHFASLSLSLPLSCCFSSSDFKSPLLRLPLLLLSALQLCSLSLLSAASPPSPCPFLLQLGLLESYGNVDRIHLVSDYEDTHYELDGRADQVESVAYRSQTVSEQEVTSCAPHGASIPARKQVSKGRSAAKFNGQEADIVNQALSLRVRILPLAVASDCLRSKKYREMVMATFSERRSWQQEEQELGREWGSGGHDRCGAKRGGRRTVPEKGWERERERGRCDRLREGREMAMVAFTEKCSWEWGSGGSDRCRVERGGRRIMPEKGKERERGRCNRLGEGEGEGGGAKERREWEREVEQRRLSGKTMKIGQTDDGD
ncbi:hypothetical protein ACLOJK_009272 [Asimina triloba]